MKRKKTNFAACCACCALALLLNPSLYGRAAADAQDPADAAPAQEAVAAPSDQPVAQPGPMQTETRLSRWVDVDALSFSLRYRNSFDTEGVHTFNDVQQKSLASGKFKFDKGGKYFVGFRAASGRYFNWSYANISGLDYKQANTNVFAHVSRQRLGLVLNAFYHDPDASVILTHEAARGWEFYIRDLYMSATPIKGITFEFGSIPIERGVGSEITTFDDDGYIAGERISVHAPEYLYFDKIAVTTAYLGDVFSPNFFDRYDRLTQWNYRQALLEKRFGSRFKASADFTWLTGTRTMREAGLVRTPEAIIFDSVRAELYQRLNDSSLPGYQAKAAPGWAFTASKTLKKRYTIEGGYASIDDDYGVYSGEGTVAATGFALNGDSYQVGKRFFWRADVKLAPFASLFGFYTHQVETHPSPAYLSLTRQNFNFGMQLDFKSMLKMGHVI